ncbi:hypothetical protein BJ166DRAFT_498141 [Pestalotiopsis sp. NC0098]|nr:hypothetical protein BJ166DRAFT_498141 [Pestalotiopsis sp. NC0098]
MASNDSISGSGGNNATEYLLSELLAVVKDKIRGDDAQTDWDPITFAFTVPVGVFGILATIFALITIIQGILAASPGRRKSSRHVIGKWAKTRKTVFNWDELRTMTFVKTPILRAEDSLPGATTNTESNAADGNNGKGTTLHGRLRNMVPIVNRRDEGWFPWIYKLQLLITYRMSYAQYMPTTDVRTMIALGAVAEAMSLEPEMGSSYPILIGARNTD